jgi:hypothetical protein
MNFGKLPQNHVCFLLFSLAVALSGAACGNRPAPGSDGRIKLVDENEPLEFKTIKGNSVQFYSGPARLDYQVKGLAAFRSVFVLKNKKNGVAFQVPTEAFRSGQTDFKVSAKELGQPYDVLASSTPIELGRREGNETRSCETTGVCWHNEHTTITEESYNSTTKKTESTTRTVTKNVYGLSNNCPGHLVMHVLYLDMQDTIEVEFFQSQMKKGSFEGKGESYVESQDLYLVKQCTAN